MNLRPQYDGFLADKPVFKKARRWHRKDGYFWGGILFFLFVFGFYFGYLVPQQRIHRTEQAIARLKRVAEEYHQQTLRVLQMAGIYIEAYKAAKLEEIPSLTSSYQRSRVKIEAPSERYRRNPNLVGQPTLEDLQAIEERNEHDREANKPLKLSEIAALLTKESQDIIINFPSIERKTNQLLSQYNQWEAAQEIINKAENQTLIEDAEQVELQEALTIDRRRVMSVLAGAPEPRVSLRSPELELALLIDKPVMKPSLVARETLLEAVKEVERSQAMLTEAQAFFDQLKNQWKLIFPKQAEPLLPVSQPNNSSNPVTNNNSVITTTPNTQQTITPQQQRQEAERLRIEAEKRAAEEKRLQEQRQREEEKRRADEALCRSGLSTNCPGKR